MIVFLQLRGFYLSAHRLPATQPAVVVRNRAILDLNDAAEREGVREGMSLPEARAILKHASSPPAILDWKRDDYETMRHAWLDRCVPYSDAIEWIDQHLAYVDLGAHPHPEVPLKGLLQDLSDLRVRWGAARVKWLSRVAVHWDDRELNAYYAPQAFLDELPTSQLEPVSEECRRRLEFLGYRTIGAVSRIPLETLKAQFGEEALTIAQASRGRSGNAIEPNYPESCASARFYFESPVEQLEAVHRGLGIVCRRLATRLSEGDLQGSVLRMWVGLEGGGEQFFERAFSKPMSTATSMLFGAKLMLQVESPVTHLRLQMPGLTKANRKQRGLYRTRTDSHLALEASVREMQSVYGESALRKASDIPLTRRQRLLKVWRDATVWS